MIDQRHLLEENELSSAELQVIHELTTGGQDARMRFFDAHREQLKQLVRFRIDRRLTRRMDDSDILQEAYLEYSTRIESYLNKPVVPPLVWIRRLVRQMLSRQSRDHLAAQCRDVRREHYLSSTSMVNVDFLSDSLTSMSSAMNRIDLRDRLRRAVDSMSPIEREILVLVHFEDRTIREAAMELGINNEAAKKRYRRALNRLRDSHESELREFHNPE